MRSLRRHRPTYTSASAYRPPHPISSWEVVIRSGTEVSEARRCSRGVRISAVEGDGGRGVSAELHQADHEGAGAAGADLAGLQHGWEFGGFSAVGQDRPAGRQCHLLDADVQRVAVAQVRKADIHLRDT